jgi:hypothetical protein
MARRSVTPPAPILSDCLALIGRPIAVQTLRQPEVDDLTKWTTRFSEGRRHIARNRMLLNSIDSNQPLRRVHRLLSAAIASLGELNHDIH